MGFGSKKNIYTLYNHKKVWETEMYNPGPVNFVVWWLSIYNIKTTNIAIYYNILQCAMYWYFP